ncbi:MAG: prepilin-type N-terminal cleavage/methylation domain-containing protein [Kofleriaceae bacterium]
MKRSQGGFTLIELMVAMVVSSLLVGMILAIFLRMSLAYRGQQQVSGIQQVLAAGRAMIEVDAKQAGLQMPQGVSTLASKAVPELISPVRIINNTTIPDQIRFLYADATYQAAVGSRAGSVLNVDDHVGFLPNDLVVVAQADLSQVNPIDPLGANVTVFTTCVAKIDSFPNATSVQLVTAAPYGDAGATHCPAGSPTTMLYKLVAHAYRIDPARPADGVLQRSPTGDLFALNDWQDLGYGFTDLQVSTQFFDRANDAADSLDPDSDPDRDWYSGEGQETLTNNAATFANAPLQMTITLVARTDKDVEGVSTAATPTLTVAGNPNSNQLGDRASVDLTTTLDPALQGPRIYRYMTFAVDLRNTGVGR